MRTLLQIIAPLTLAALLVGCTVSPRTGLVCPPGTHPGPWGHHCFAD